MVETVTQHNIAREQRYEKEPRCFRTSSVPTSYIADLDSVSRTGPAAAAVCACNQVVTQAALTDNPANVGAVSHLILIAQQQQQLMLRSGGNGVSQFVLGDSDSAARLANESLINQDTVAAAAAASDRASTQR